MQTTNGVLVLNKSWIPIHVCSVPRAISMIYQDCARAVARDYQIHDFESWREFSLAPYDDAKLVNTPSYSIVAPEVVLLTNYHKVPPFVVRLNRRNLFLRDRHTCQYCGCQPGAKNLTIDHVVPRAKGGKTTWENVVLACRDCNSQKADLSLDQAGLTLSKKARRPSWMEILKAKKSESIFKESNGDHDGYNQKHPLWEQFIDDAYWNVTLDK